MENNQISSHFEVYVEQVSGKQPKLLSDDHTKVLKGLNETERNFYRQISSFHISHPFASICCHIPKYHGILQLDSDPEIKLEQENHEKGTLVWLNHLAARYKARNDSNKFIILQNLTYGWQLPNIFDIKIGGRNVEGKKHKITKSVFHFFMKLNGCKMHFAANQYHSVFLSKYYLAEVIEAGKILECLGLFFFDGSKLQVETIKIIREKLQDLILSFKALRGYKFISSSVCIIYDAKHPSMADVKLLDFGRVMHCSPDFVDEDSISGLVNIHLFLSKIIENGPANDDKFNELRKFYCENEIIIIPEKKKIKYHDQSDQTPTKN